MPTIYGERPRPRAIITGFPEDVANRLAGLFPTAEVVDDPGLVHQADFDVLVGRNTDLGVAPHLFVVGFASFTFGWVNFEDGHFDANKYWVTEGQVVDAGRRVAAREFTVPDGVSSSAQGLVDAVLHPLLARRQEQAYLAISIGGTYVRWVDEPALRPFFTTSDGFVLACECDRMGGEAQCWAFAEDIDDPVPFVQAALERWAEVAPDRFPRIEGWEESPAWMTPEEVSALRSLDAAKDQRERELQILDAEVAQREAELKAKQGEADSGPRRLLTAQGDDLLHSVVDALTDLGFEVQDMDEVWSAGDKLEDLRVRLPGGDWTAVVEVRGYARGAQQRDLLRIGRFVLRYLRDLRTMPDAAWYVVNQFRSQDPASRPRALASNDPEIAEFSESEPPGLVIDTVELFKLWQAVGDKRVSQEEARTLLTTSTGRFEAPSNADLA